MSINMSLPSGGYNFMDVPTIQNPPYMNVFQFEKFELNWWRRKIGTYWAFSIYCSFVYIILIFLGQNFMKNRKAYELKWLLSLWNSALAIFSIIGFYRSLGEFVDIYSRKHGFYYYVCTREGHNSATAFWGCLFMLSKVVELGDTVFIILKKRPLIFLHWYHHATVFCFCWYAYEGYEPTVRFFAILNYFIHGLMYSYFALMSLGVKIPKNLAKTITVLQITQMLGGMYVNLYTYWAKEQGFDCPVRSRTVTVALLMYTSYFLLFAKFYNEAYIMKIRKQKTS